MNSILWNDSDKKNASGITIIGMQFAAVISHLTANTAFTANPLDWSLIKAQLRFFKKKTNKWHVIFNDALLPLILMDGFYDGTFQQNLQVGAFVANVTVAAGGGVKEILKYNGKIRFPTPINCLEPGDELVFEIQVPNGALAATADPALSRFYYDWVQGIGLGSSVPVLQAEAVRASQSSDTFSAGEGVQKVCFVNVDKSGITDAVQVITNADMRGDLMSDSDDNSDLLSKRNGMFEDLAQANVRNQSFMLFDMARSNYSGMPTRMNQLNFSFTYTAGNVNAGKNWYVTWKLVNDSAVYQFWKDRLPGQLEQNVAYPAR